MKESDLSADGKKPLPFSGCCGGGDEREDEVQLILIMMIMIQNLQHHRLVQDAPSALHMAYGM